MVRGSLAQPQGRGIGKKINEEREDTAPALRILQNFEAGLLILILNKHG